MAIAVSVVPQFAQVVTIDFGSVTADLTIEPEITVPGALKDHIYLAIPEGTWNAGLSFPIGYGSDANKIKFRIMNATAGGLDPASQTFKILGF